MRLLSGLAFGVNVLIAGYLGKKEQDNADTVVTHGLLLAFGIGALLNLFALLIMSPTFGHLPVMKKSISEYRLYERMFVYANTKYGAYRNPENDTGHRKYGCSHVVPDCRSGR